MERLRETQASTARRFAASIGIACAVAVAWSNAWDTAFVFDDHRAITGNPVVVSEPLWVALVRPDTGTVGGAPLSRRPLAAFGFALNHRLTGPGIAGFRAVNLALHVATACLLLLWLESTLARSGAEGVRRDAFPLAASVALLWAVHPLQTAALTYTVQRAEAQASAFYVAALLCFLRGCEARESGRPGANAWIAAAVLAGLAAMGSKEMAVSLPLTLLLYDRVFVSGSFREAWRRHGRWHAALFACWIALAAQVSRLIAGAGVSGGYLDATPLAYALSQAYFLCRYVFLVFWPGPLVFDYGFEPVTDPLVIAGCGALVVAAIAGTLRAFGRVPALFFAGYAFFALLAPTSSVITIGTQIAAEHRMYLASAVPIALAVLALHRLGVRRAALALTVLALAAGLGARTWVRNRDYTTERRLWEASLRVWPENARAQATVARLTRDDALGLADPTERAAALHEALGWAERAIERQPDYGAAVNDRGEIRLLLGDRDGALADFDRAIELFPSDPLAYYNRGRMRHREDPAAADADYSRALAVGPQFVVAALNRGALRLAQGRPVLALADFDHVLRYRPDHAMAWENRGVVLERLGRVDEATASHERALALYRDLGFEPGVQRAEAALARLRR